MKYLILLSVFLCTGCEIISYDRTNENIASKISAQCFMTLKSSFSYVRCGSENIKLGLFDSNSCLPKDEKELEEKMKLVQCSSDFSLLTKLCDNNYIAMYEVGTPFTVTNVISKAMGETGRHWSIFGKIEGGVKRVEMPSKWFRPYWVTNEKVTINRDYLTPCTE